MYNFESVGHSDNSIANVLFGFWPVLSTVLVWCQEVNKSLEMINPESKTKHKSVLLTRTGPQGQGQGSSIQGQSLE